VSRALLKEAGEVGLLSFMISRELGGEGHGWLDWGRVLWQLSYLCDDLGFPFLLGYELSLAKRLVAATHLPELHPSHIQPMIRGDAFASFCWTENDSAFTFRTIARRTKRGYALNGWKGPITAGLISDHFLVYARELDHGDVIGVLVGRSDPGVSVVPMPPMGLRSTGQAEVRFDAVEVDLGRVFAPADGLSDAQKFLNERRIAIPCMIVGRLEALREAMVDDLRERVRYGTRLIDMQAVQATLGRATTAIDASCAMVERMLAHVDQAEQTQSDERADATWDPIVATTKYFVVEQALTVIQLAQHVLGGRWYFDRWPYGRWFRDLQGFVAAAGTQGIVEVDLGILAAHESERRAASRKRGESTP
jgi:alkylation response protein AidB-like acyl-CoA dehydrogenase